MKANTKRPDGMKTTEKARNCSLETQNSGKTVSGKTKSCLWTGRRSVRGSLGDVELLDMLIKKIIEKLEKNSWEAKVQDVLRAIQLKHKLTASSAGEPSSGRDRVSDAEKSFWQMIDEIRREEMGKLNRQSTEATSDGKEQSENA